MTSYCELKLYIDGEWVGHDNRSTQEVINPANGEVLGLLPMASSTDLDQALTTAHRGYQVWRKKSVDERSGVLRGAASLLRQRIERIARIATLEQGKTLAESRIEVHMAANLFDFYGEECKRIYGRMLARPTGRRALVVKEPIGPVAAFAPWNFPIGNPARKLGAAIGAGCSCILKPAEEAPGSALEVLRALLDAGLPKEVASVVFGIPHEVSSHLIASPIIRKVSFTGSVTVGKQLMRLAADGMKRTTMELGGHAPVLVFDDADIEQCLDLTTASKFRNAGQVCIAPTRFYVHEKKYDAFVEGFVRRSRELTVGDGLVETNRMGPMANGRRIAAMGDFIGDAVAKGAKIQYGGERHGNRGFFWKPTILTDVPQSARIMKEEPFGPVATIAPFQHDDEAIAQANRLPYGLAAYAFTQSAKRIMTLGDSIEAGMVGLNTTMIGAADSPFGGVKDSGHGSEDGPEGLEACLVTKAIHQA
jgi:succinate-semialdehyde dehydrogenase/glutarate-semialdehyde dehydrogenase